MKPLYEHDCDNCVFLGTFRNTDLYCCDNKHYRTHIVRYSNEGGDYCSKSESIDLNGYEHIEMLECVDRAKDIPYKYIWRRRMRKLIEKLGIRRSRSQSKNEQFKLFVVELLTIFDSLVYVCTLGFYTSDLHCKLLFSNWMDDED